MPSVPVSQKVINELKSCPDQKGDTTGCGDNFTGGIISSVANQLKNRIKGNFNLIDALSWGVASGGINCFNAGGTYFEKYRGEKLERVIEFRKEYLKQIGR